MAANPAGSAWTQFLFVALPYAAVLMFLVSSIWRYRDSPYSYSSLSSQFLENERHFWAMVPFHLGLLAVLAGHVVGFALPAQLLAWNSRPLRLYVLELSGLVCALLALVGLAMLIQRRAVVKKIRIVTSSLDWVVLGLLLLQIASGIAVAIFRPWGSAWFATSASPYLWSLVKLQPQVQFIAMMPWLVKLHIVGFWLFLLLLPFSRLVHILVVPHMYLWRKPQVVRWWRAAA
jgi:nitrate reductase gamma subunit